MVGARSAILSVVLCGPVAAQAPVLPPAEPPAPAAPAPTAAPAGAAAPRDLRIDLRKVEQGVADRGPLSALGRVQPIDLRQSNDFRDVYQIPKDAPGPYAGWYLRQSGSVFALFPQSTYETFEGGMMVTVPPDTRYLISRPEDLAEALGLNPPVGPVTANGSQPLSLALSAPISLRLQGPMDTREVLSPRVAPSEAPPVRAPRLETRVVEPTATIAPSVSDSARTVAPAPTAAPAPLGDAGRRTAAVFEGSRALDGVVAELLGHAQAPLRPTEQTQTPKVKAR